MRPHTTALVLASGAGRQRWLAISAVLAIVLVALLIAVTAFTRLEFEEADPPATAGPDTETAPAPPAVESIALKPVGEPEPAAAEAPAEIPLEEQDELSFDPDGPCAGVTGPAAKKLLVTPESVTLVGGNRTGAVDISNCDSTAVTWNAATEVWVSLAETQGQLPSGATFRLLFTVDTASLPTGSYSFDLVVSRPGHSVVVQVSGLKLGGLIAPGHQPPPEPTIGGLVSNGPRGCAKQCITKAWLTTRPGSADISLEVVTNTSATIAVLVDTEAPEQSTSGDPFFTSPTVHTTSDGPRTRWVTTLSPLQPDTAYHIIVAAKDGGGVSYRTGSFRTVTVASGFANQVPGGCTASCVKSALLTRQADGTDVRVTVQAHVPLRMEVRVNGEVTESSRGSYVTQWATTLDLEPGRNYDIALQVTDEQGNRQTHQAKVSTPKPIPSHQNRVRVIFHKIWVSNDADNTFFNRKGELRFKFAIDGQHHLSLDTGEHKVKAPTWLSLADGRAEGRGVTLDNVPDVLQIRVQGQERDKAGQRGFCSAGVGMFPDTSGREVIPDCFALEWNTAEGWIDLHPPDQPQALPPCYGFGDGIHGDLCVILKATGDDPTFDVYLTIDFLEE